MGSDDSEKNLRAGLPEISRYQIYRSALYNLLSIRGYIIITCGCAASHQEQQFSHVCVTPEKWVYHPGAGADPVQLFAFTGGPEMPCSSVWYSCICDPLDNKEKNKTKKHF